MIIILIQIEAILLKDNNQLINGYLYYKKLLFPKIINIKYQLVSLIMSLNIIYWVKLKKNYDYNYYFKNWDISLQLL